MSLSDLADSKGSSIQGDIPHPILPLPTHHISENQSRFKYVDDLALAEAVDLNALEPITESLPLPLNFRERIKHNLPSHKNTL